MKKFFLTILLLAMTYPAHAFCSKPMNYLDPPQAPNSLQKPNKPLCLLGFEYSGTHSCSEWEIENYLSDVEDYLQDLRRYGREVDRYADEVINFLDSADRFIKCETEDVLGDLK